jgi:type I pantothenate kinase
MPKEGRPYVSDFFDFSIYIDAAEDVLEGWYVKRFMRLRETAFRDPRSYFNRYSKISDADAREMALSLWRNINLANLRENILPTRLRASLILGKNAEHAIETVALRKL